MNNQKRMLALLLLLAVSCTAGASDIYKRVNQDGVVEFSDKPFPGATRVTVDPNVVATNPVQRPARPAASAEADEAADSAGPTALAVDTQTNYVRARTRRELRAEQNRRENRRESRTYRNTRDEEVTDPDPGRALRNAVRNAPAPGPR